MNWLFQGTELISLEPEPVSKPLIQQFTAPSFLKISFLSVLCLPNIKNTGNLNLVQIPVKLKREAKGECLYKFSTCDAAQVYETLTKLQLYLTYNFKVKLNQNLKYHLLNY